MANGSGSSRFGRKTSRVRKVIVGYPATSNPTQGNGKPALELRARQAEGLGRLAGRRGDVYELRALDVKNGGLERLTRNEGPNPRSNPGKSVASSRLLSLSVRKVRESEYSYLYEREKENGRREREGGSYRESVGISQPLVFLTERAPSHSVSRSCTGVSVWRLVTSCA